MRLWRIPIFTLCLYGCAPFGHLDDAAILRHEAARCNGWKEPGQTLSAVPPPQFDHPPLQKWVLRREGWRDVIADCAGQPAIACSLVSPKVCVTFLPRLEDE